MRILGTLILLLATGTLLHAQNAIGAIGTRPTGQPRNMLFGDFTLGISNYGMAGEMKMYHRVGNKLFTAGYYQSHICAAGDYDGLPPWKAGGVTHHISFFSYSAGFGYMLNTRSKQGLTAGISMTRFTFERTDPIYNDFGIAGLSRELGGDGFGDNSHGSDHKMVIGIPIEYKVFLFQKGAIGLDVAAKADLNLTRVFTAITLGVRIGKIC